jgi:hypothetical protein
VLHHHVSDPQYTQRCREGFLAHRQEVEPAAEERGPEASRFGKAARQARCRSGPLATCHDPRMGPSQVMSCRCCVQIRADLAWHPTATQGEAARPHRPMMTIV